jgi:hypothetical protein
VSTGFRIGNEDLTADRSRCRPSRSASRSAITMSRFAFVGLGSTGPVVASGPALLAVGPTHAASRNRPLTRRTPRANPVGDSNPCLLVLNWPDLVQFVTQAKIAGDCEVVAIQQSDV